MYVYSFLYSITNVIIFTVNNYIEIFSSKCLNKIITITKLLIIIKQKISNYN